MSYQLRPNRRSALFVFALAALFMAACSARSLSGNNWPGISAADNTVYLAYGPAVAAIDIDAQRELWQYVPADPKGALLAPPTADNNIIYMGDYGASQGTFTPGVVASIYAVDGSDINGNSPREVWPPQQVAKDRFVGPILSANGALYAGTADNEVIALDASTGKAIWPSPFEAEHSIWGQPAYRDGVVFVTSLDRHIYALDADTGAVKWQQELSGAIAASPLVIDDMVYVASFDKKLHALDAADGNEQWVVEATDWLWNAPAYANGKLFFGDVQGAVFAVDAQSGNIEWQIDIDGSIEAGLAVNNGTVFIPVIHGLSQTDQTGEIVAVSAENGKIDWRVDLDRPVYTPPLIAADQLVVLVTTLESTTVGDFELRTFNLESGSQIWSYVPVEPGKEK